MRFFTVSLASLAALALVGGFSLNAAHAMTKPGTPVVASGLEQVAAKAKKAKAKKAGAGRCGTYMYYKGKKCQDARAKK